MLVITILVIIVLAGAVILTVSKNNPLGKANESVFKSDLKNFLSEFNLKIVEEIGKGKDVKKINVEVENGNWKDYIPSIEEKIEYKKILEIVEGKLYIKEDATVDEIRWAEEVGIEIKSPKTPEYGYNNPYIPNGFEHTEGTVDTGYVIKDTASGNEFVWIQVRNIADFKRTDFRKGQALSACTETLPSNITTSVAKYGGYYIGRYEQGRGNISKKGVDVWNEIHDDSINYSSKMYNTSEIATELIYGIMWDTACNWLVSSGNKTQEELLDSTSWGNYWNNTVEGHGLRQKTGYSETWKANNIYDFAR